MPVLNSDAAIPFPKAWPARVRSAVLCAISLAQSVTTGIRAKVAESGVASLRLQAVIERLEQEVVMLQEEIREYYWKHHFTRDLLELRNIATVAALIVECASARHESRGLHTTIDHPATDTGRAVDTLAKRGVPAHLRGQ